MYTIGICDDEEMHRQHIRRLCEEFFAENAYSYQLVEFQSGEEVLAYRGEQLHLLFLDVELGETDGIHVLRRLENTDMFWRVVFVTSHEEVVWDSFGIKTLGFAKKPVTYQQIAKWLQTTIRENKEKLVLEYISGAEKGCVALEDVLYLAAEGNYTCVHSLHTQTLINENLKYWQSYTEQMPVVRIHKSYLVNLLQVQKWETGKVILTNGEELAIGRQYAKEAREAYFAFVREQAMRRM